MFPSVYGQENIVFRKRACMNCCGKTTKGWDRSMGKGFNRRINNMFSLQKENDKYWIG